jgi:peptide/nickel transport system permease protein
MFNYLRRNKILLVGIFLLGFLAMFTVLGYLFWDVQMHRPLSAPANQSPTWDHPFGTDRQGRDLLAVIIAGTPLTLYIGVLAGAIGVVVGTVLALISAYYGGTPDTLIRGAVDVGLTIPPLLVLILIAVSIEGGLSVTMMAIIVASLSWLWPTRSIRAQVLSIKERAYVQIAKLSGTTGIGVIVKELLPNLLPYILATFVSSTAAAILASVGLEVLGLGPMDSPTLGMTIYWVQFNAALLHGMWWWFLPPIIVIIMLFIGLFATSVGLDELANPRTRRAV